MKNLPYPPRVPLAQLPSPLTLMERLSQEVGGTEIWIKRDDLTGIELTGNKSRKLEFLVAQAQSEGRDALFTYGALQSNHCRATAAVGAQLGFPTRLILLSDPPQDEPRDGNHLLDDLFGAEISYIPRETFLRQKTTLLQQTLDAMKSEGRNPFYFPVGGSVPVGVWAYVKCMEELWEQTRLMNLKAPHIITACGSGGTAAGLILGRALLGWKEARVSAIAVCLNAAFWKAELRRLLDETVKAYQLDISSEDLPIHVTDAYVGAGYAVSYPEEIQAIRQVARLEGILLDPVYTGKAMTGALDWIRRGDLPRSSPVIFMHTGGVFGLFPMRSCFL